MSPLQYLISQRYLRQVATTAGTVLLSVLVTILVMSALAPSAITAQPAQMEEVRAAAFVLVGADGTVLARLAPGATGNGNLTLFDTAGRQRAFITGNGTFALSDEERSRIVMGVIGIPGLSVLSPQGRARVALGLTADGAGSAVTVSDDQARVRAVVGVGLRDGFTGFQVRDEDGQTVASMP